MICSSPNDYPGPFVDMVSELGLEHDGGIIHVLSDEQSLDLVARYNANFNPYFPFRESVLLQDGKPRIDWDSYVQQCHDFLEKAFVEAGVIEGTTLNVMWDIMGYPSVAVNQKLINLHIDSFISMGGAHTYILPTDATWCVCFKTGGIMGYGIANPKLSYT